MTSNASLFVLILITILYRAWLMEIERGEGQPCNVLTIYMGMGCVESE